MNNNRTFLITGATKGIGHATANRLHAQGHKVIGIARQKTERQFPGILYQADLTDETTTKKIFEEINQTHVIDGIVNNVGIPIPQPLHEITLQNFTAVLDLNLRPALQAAQIFTPGMISRKWGRIVNVSSRGVLGAENLSSFAAAKSGLISFTRVWALELAKTGITINAVAPGYTETESFRKTRPEGSEAEKKALQMIPMSRIGNPDEIAAAIEFFLSEDASFITGQTLFVDGGASVGRVIS